MRIRHPRHQHRDSRPCINPHAAGLDIGSDEIWACVPEDRDAEPVRSFGTFTPDLYALAEWLATCRDVDTSVCALGCCRALCTRRGGHRTDSGSGSTLPRWGQADVFDVHAHRRSL